MNIDEIRKQFDYLSTGKIYFNHASIGPLPAKTVQAVEKYLFARSANEINNFMNYLAVDKRAKKKLGKILGCRPERLAWKDNVGNGMSLLSSGLDWKTGDRIILADIEFPSNVYPFLNLKREGVEVDFVKSEDGILSVAEYEKLITPRTKLISVSMVQFLSGYRTDIKELSDLCRSRGIILSVDAIQAAGAIQIKAEEWGVDFITGGAQKWLLGMEGLSYIYVSEELQDMIKQKDIGWGSVANAWELLDYDLTLNPTAQRYQSGTPNSAGVFAADASLGLFVENGMKQIEKRILNNSKYLIEKLKSLGYSPILGEEEEKHIAGIVTFNSQNAERIKEELGKKKIIVEVRVGRVRISPHFYNTKEEIDSMIEALREIK